MANWKIEISGKGIRRDQIRKIVDATKEKFGEVVQTSIQDNTPPESRADRFANAMSLVDDAKCEVEALRDELQEWYDNLPENFQQGDKGQQLEEAISNLDEVANNCDSVDTGNIEFPGMF